MRKYIMDLGSQHFYLKLGMTDSLEVNEKRRKWGGEKIHVKNVR